MPDFKMTDRQKELFAKLTPLQQKVCINIVSGMSNIDAFMSANQKIKNRVTGEASVSRMLRDVKVEAFLDSMKEAAVSDAVMSRQEMLERLSSMARTNVNDLIVWRTEAYKDDEGEEVVQSIWQLKDSAMQDPNLMASISELSATKEGFKFKLHDQKAAMKQIAEMAGYNEAQKIDVTHITKADEEEW